MFALAGIAVAAGSDTVLVGRGPGPAGAKGNDFSFQPSISGDGRIVAFGSNATNLHPADRDRRDDVFVRDLRAHTIRLASRASDAAGPKGNGRSFAPAISANGRFVAFNSTASTLHPDDRDGDFDVFMRDLRTDTTVLVSRASGAAGTKANGGSGAPSISANGRFVAFASLATNLDPDDPDATSDVYVRDLRRHTTILVSRASGPSGAKGNDDSEEFFGDPSISADGRVVAFSSNATNLHPDDRGVPLDVFVRDIEAGTTSLVSRASGATGSKGNGSSFDPSISGAGRFVAFASRAANLVPADPSHGTDVFVRDLQRETTRLVSRSSGRVGAKGDRGSRSPAISRRGRFVAFGSGATNLHPDDAALGGDIFVRDLQVHTTVLASRASGARGAKGNRPSFFPSLSADGRFVAFQSNASNLHPNDRGEGDDVFVRELGAPPLPGRRASAAGDERQ
jgi:Tol biopolymer transport system component